MAKKPTAAQKAAKEAEAQAAQEAKAAEAAQAQEADAQSIFDLAVGFVLREKIEGGYVNDPRDPGGETNFGISKRSFPNVNMRELTRERAIAIYKEHYWDATGCDDLPPMLAVALFDCAVNQGPGIAPKLLQKALGVAADGKIGPKTRAAAERAEPTEALALFLGWRLRRYAFTPNAATYMRGWANRVLYLQQFLLTHIAGAE